MATDAISCYCAMFFDVRDRLKATGWIQLAVLEPLRVIALQPNSTELQKRRYSLATFAYKGGPHVLNELLDIWRIGGPNRATIESSAEDLLSRELRARTLEAALLIEPTQKNASPLIKLAMKLAKDKEPKTQFARPLPPACSRTCNSSQAVITARLIREGAVVLWQVRVSYLLN